VFPGGMATKVPGDGGPFPVRLRPG
jgi:hypothetical protein